jgi:hypothetical protein
MVRPTRWALLAGTILAVGATIVWWSTRRPAPPAEKQLTAIEQAADEAAKSDPRAGEVLRLMREKGMSRSAMLVDLYTRLAGDKSAVGVRALALNALFSEESLPLRLKGVLDAVASDETPSGEDPLWPNVVQKLSDQWKPEVFDKGRDLMLADQRPRVRQALVASFVHFVETGQAANLTPEQNAALLTDLVDMHGFATADQRPSIQGAVRKIGGNDPADLLAGKHPNELELHAEEQRQLQLGANTLLKGKRLSQ